MEKALLIGGAATSAGLFVGQTAATQVYQLTSRLLRSLTGDLASWRADGALEEKKVSQFPALPTFALVAYDPLNGGGTLLVTPNGVFYVTALKLKVYRFCKAKAGGLMLPRSPFFLMHAARATCQDGTLEHNSVVSVPQQVARQRYAAFVSDCALHMLLNDLSLVTNLSLAKIEPYYPRLQALLKNLLAPPKASSWTLVGQIGAALGVGGGAPTGEPLSARLLHEFFFTNPVTRQYEPLDLSRLGEFLWHKSGNKQSFLARDYVDTEETVDEHVASTLGVELFLPWWTPLPMRVYVKRPPRPRPSEASAPPPKPELAFLEQFAEPSGAFRYLLLLPRPAAADDAGDGGGGG